MDDDENEIIQTRKKLTGLNLFIYIINGHEKSASFQG